MNYLMRRDPFTDLRSTMDRLFDEGFSRPALHDHGDLPGHDADSKSLRPTPSSSSRRLCPAHARRGRRHR